MKYGRMLKYKVITVLLMILLMPLRYGSAESINADLLFTGQYTSPVTICVSAPSYKHIAQFGEERTENLNKLFSHLELSVCMDGNISRTTLKVDQEPLYYFDESVSDVSVKTVYSFDPNTVYERDMETTEQDRWFIRLLDDHFFSLNRMLDDLYPLFEKCADTFRDSAKASATSLTFRGYGKGVKKILISFSDQYVTEHFPGALSQLADTEESRQFIENLKFKGPQKIMLLYDQNEKLLRINYDGAVGLNEDSMRRVSLAWRCVRSDIIKKDNLSLKTPAQKGNDKYNISYEREIDFSDPDCHIIKWDLQTDLKSDLIKKKITGKADLLFSEEKLHGQISFSEKQDNDDRKITITPSLLKENDSEYEGTIEITDNSGKIVLSSIAASIRIASGDKLTFPEEQYLRLEKATDSDESSAADQLQDRQNAILIRRLLSLPAEDLVFFSMDIPNDVWKSLTQSLK